MTDVSMRIRWDNGAQTKAYVHCVIVGFHASKKSTTC